VSFRGTQLAGTLIFRLILIAICACAVACRSRDTSTAKRLFVAPLSNLSADPGLDWFGRAVSDLIVTRTVANPSVQTVDHADSRATHSLEGYFSESGGVLHVRAAVRDLASQKVVNTTEARGSASDVLRISEELIRSVGGNPRPYTTSSVAALRSFYSAVGTGSAEQVLARLNAAIAADPFFGTAHVGRIQTFIALNRFEDARVAIEAASAAGIRLTEEERLRLAEAQATLSGDNAGRARATRELARLRPADGHLWKTAAELSLLVKDYPAAIDAFNNALKLDPDNIALWNTLGYAYAYAGDLTGAKRAFGEYRRIAPNDANALDSLGEVHYYLGRFADAEKYFLEAFNKNKAQLGGGEAMRAGMARLMMGDRAAADKHFAAYLDFRRQSGDTLLPVRQALWQFWTGHRSQAVSALEKIDDPPESAVAARLLLSLCYVQFGDSERARKFAAEAVRLAKNPQSAALAAIAIILTSPARAIGTGAGSTGKPDPVRRQLLGYSLLLHRNYAEAAGLWSEIYNKTSAISGQDERVLLAWAEAERGNLAEVSTLMRAFALPPASAEPGVESILFPRSIFLKALAEQHENNQTEARRLFKLFLDYSADRDFVYGEEKRAREALASQ
jgi:Flp pilus assembly protein TadD